MTSEYLEIVEMEDGTFALQRMDGDSEPLVMIHFSQEVLSFFKDHKVDIARAMIGAGVHAASELSRQAAKPEATVSTTLH